MTVKRQPMTLTDAAAAQIQNLIASGEGDILGLRVGVKNTGCSGMSYFMEYARDTQPFEEVLEDKGVKVFIDSKSLMFMLGTEMDYVTDEFGSHFAFKNPNEDSRCGCGESFSVKKDA